MRDDLEFIGMIGIRPDTPGAAVHVISGGLDRDWVADFARAHEDAGFDKVLVGYSPTSADGLIITAYAASQTQRIGFLIAHRPGIAAPVLAARSFATLDNVTGGRVALHVVTGGSDSEMHREGDWLNHDTRYRRTDEYLQVLRNMWTYKAPFDFDGEFYHIEGASCDVKAVQQPHVPIYFGGASEVALQVAARHADVYALWGEPLAATRDKIADIRTRAAAYGRSPRFSVSFRPIIAPTEKQAWEKAHAILDSITALDPAKTTGSMHTEAVGAQRLVQFAQEAEVHDKRLWTAIAAAVSGSGNSTALVGTPEQVADALLDYYDLGVTTLLIRGFNPLADAIEYGRELIPIVRDQVAKHRRSAIS